MVKHRSASHYNDLMVLFSQVQRREAESHLQSATRIHLDLACVMLNDTQEELKETTRKLEEKFNSSQRELNETRRKLEERINALELNRQMQCPEEHRWKISGFSEVLRQAKTRQKVRIESDPFYKYGYKCNLILYPNGNGSRKNTHLSLYFVIMKGEYDAALPWPFHKNVTISLIDQQENLNDRMNIVKSFMLDSERINFARPVTDKNTPLGFPEFMPQNQLKKRRYVVDDTLFIQVKVATPQQL